ncbi:hypothetical protein DFQ27_005036 [Actinomortierella ambigua]|uniref:EF-hand domain-containing protein n=1 Tax=Actinomortierella ambigua TaxID=1343610 RepID=A0A9P6Q227_9FUNG|nr:hypothetical protein DFQ27_005036 [Actinomortierella ambigua]
MSSNDPTDSLDWHDNHAAPAPVSDDEPKDRGSIKLMEVHLTSVPVPNKNDARRGVASPSSPTTGSSNSGSSSSSRGSSSSAGTAPTTTTTTASPPKAPLSNTNRPTVTTATTASSSDLPWPESGSDLNEDPSMDASGDGSSDPVESALVEELGSITSTSTTKKKAATKTSATTARRPLSHYETREERLARIRKQFSPLNERSSSSSSSSSQDGDNAFLDANSLVGFFADISPDENVQRRYADELLQLCHRRKLRRSLGGSGGGGGSSPRPRSTAKTKKDGSTPVSSSSLSSSTATATTTASSSSSSLSPPPSRGTVTGARVAGMAGVAGTAGGLVARSAVSGDSDQPQSKEEGAAASEDDDIMLSSSLVDFSELSSEAGIQASVEGDGVVNTTGSHLMFEDSHDDEDGDAKRPPRVLYSDFQIFVEEKEERLWNLFQEIDHNNDHEIQPEELQASLAKAGIHLSEGDLEQFVKAIDKDGNGVIDYDEWRDFLVLLPRETTLKEIYKYVQEVIAQVGVDGDVVIPPSDHEYVVKYLLAGAIAGAVSRTVTAPLDRLKVYLITNSAVSTLTGPKAVANLKNIPNFSSNLVRQPPQQRLLWSAIMDLYHQGGVRTFFRGNGLNIVKIAPESAIKFYMYETSKWLITSHLPFLTNAPSSSSSSSSSKNGGNGNGNGSAEISTAGRFLAGGIAGLASQFSIYPLETIKTRIMSSTGKNPNAGGQVRLCISSVGKEIWQRAGLRGFYRGLGASLVGIFPYAAIDLSVFETLKFGYMKWKAKGSPDYDSNGNIKLERPSVFVLLACGTISGSVGATTVYPLSLVRTRLQAQGTPQHPQTYSSTLDVFRKTYQQDGIRGFYKGMVPTLTKVVPAVSISYVVYEYSKQKLGLDR